MIIILITAAILILIPSCSGENKKNPGMWLNNKQAYEQILPMVKRVKENDGFYEWITRNNEPRGSGTFRGSAGVLYKAILMFEEPDTH